MTTPELNINNGRQVLVQEQNLIITSQSFTNECNTIRTYTESDQVNKLTGGNYDLTADLGNIALTALTNDILLTSASGEIILTAGDTVFSINNNGNITLDGAEIEIGTSNTSNIDFSSSNNITLSSDAITAITTDNIILKTTDGEIILDTSPSSGNNAITIDNAGNVIVNGNSSRYGYQLEVNVENPSTQNVEKNGISVNNVGHTNVSPEIRAVYENADGSGRVINSLGVYSENDSSNKYREYTGYQYGNQIITISGDDFTNNDIGRTITFEYDERTTEITNLGTIILPADNTFASSGITLTAGGIYTGSTNKLFMIKVDGTSSTETFTWSADGGQTWSGRYIPITYATGQRYPLSDGIYITFSADTGHVLNDYWTIQAKRTAIVNSNIIIEGSVTNDGSSGTVVTGVTDNIPDTITSVLGAPVFSNIAGNIAISRLQPFKTSVSGLVGFIGTSTNNDLIIQSAGEPRFTLTADGSLGIGSDDVNARIQATSNFNKSTLVNGNILNSNVIADSGSVVIGENSNVASNILNYQQNPVSTELNTGGYVIVYESQSSGTTGFDIYGDAFTGNGDKIGNSFRINYETSNNQSHPHIAKSGTSTSDNYMAVWTSNIGGAGYGIRGQLLSNYSEKAFTSSDIAIASTGYTPRVTGLTNGNYVITYCVYNSGSGKYEVRYQIFNSTCTSVVKSETTIASGAGTNYIYPYVVGLSSKDANRPSGFVIAYLKQVYTSDARYQSVFKLFDADGSNESSEVAITTTSISGPSDVEGDTDLSLSDSLLMLERLPDLASANEGGGFMVAYQINYSASVVYSDVVDAGVRNVYSVSGNGNGDLTAAAIDPSTGIQTLTLSDINGTFLVDEQIYLVGENGYLTEKIASVTIVGTTATIVLSRDPKSIAVARFDSTGTLIWRNTSVSSTSLKLDKELEGLSSRLPEDYLREGNNHYAYRGLPSIKSNNNDQVMMSWNNGALPSIYYQLVSIDTGAKIGKEYLLGREIIGLRQINPTISSLNTRQGISLGYSVAYNTCSMDLSKTAIYQELVGVNSYIAKFANKQLAFVVDNNGKMGLGTETPSGTIHIKTSERLQTATTADTCSAVFENGTDSIITNSDSHRMSFKTTDGTELARISVKYSQNYQSYTNNQLVAYFKFDETDGAVLAQDYGIYNIQSNTASDTSSNKIQDAQLIDFDVNSCWVKGKVNNGLEFNGTSSYLKVPTDNNLSDVVRSIDTMTTDSFSISFWFKISGEYVPTNTEMDILSYGTDEVGTADGGFFQLYFRDIDSTGALKTCFKWAETVGGGNTEVTTTNKVNDDEWHHLAVVHTRGSTTSSVRIYLDNTSILNSDLGAYINDTQSITDRNIYIGAGISGSSNYFRGILDEFRVYRSVLTSSELAELWTYGNENRGQITIQTAGDNANYATRGPGLTIDDSGKILSARIKNQAYFTLTGTVIATAESTTLTGSGTVFLQEVKAGDVLYIDNVDSSLETGGIYSGLLNQKQYIITNVVSNTELVINRTIPDVTTTRYFKRINVRPSITSFFDVNNGLKGFMDYYGDLVVGEAGKSGIEYAKMEIRGSGESATNKNGLLLTNTSTSSLNTDGGRVNRLLTQSSNSAGTTTVLQGMVTTAHSGTGSDDKSKIQFWVNDGTATTNISDLTPALTIYDNAVVNFGQTEQRGNLLGDIHLRGQSASSATVAIFSEKAATGTYTESGELVFYGVDSINSTYSDDRALAKILVSNDNPNPPDAQLVNGRIDLQVNSEVGSSVSGLKTRLAITSDGSVGIHNIRPTNPLAINPEFVDNGELINSATITGYTSATRLLTFDTGDIMFNTASNAALLRSGVLVINNGTSLTTYNFDDGVVSTLNPTQYQIRLDSETSSTLSNDDSELVGQDFTIYYPGLQVNKYGLVGIGDAGFGDNNNSYHLTVSGSSLIKGEINLAANIAVSEANAGVVGIKANVNNTKLQVKDTTTDGYVNLISGPATSAIIETGVDRTLSWSADSTIISSAVADTTMTLPTPTESYKGYIFTIKNTSSTGNVSVYGGGANIDGSTSNVEITTQNDVKQLQTDGVEWYVLSPISTGSGSGSGNSLTDASVVTITAPLVDINASTEVNVSNNLKIGGTIYLGSSQTELEIGELGTTDHLLFNTTTNNKNLVFTSNIDSTANTEIIQIGSISGDPGMLISSTNTLNFNDTTANISSSTSGTMNIKASTVAITGDVTVADTTTFSDNVYFNDTTANISSTVSGTMDIKASTIAMTGDVTVADTTTFSDNVYFNDTTANISSTVSGNLDVAATNINLEGRVEIKETIKMNKKVVMAVDTIEVGGANDATREELITSSLEATNKSIVLSDTAANGTVLYYNCNLGGEMGELLNIFYYNANVSGTANIDFGSSNIYGGEGAGRFLEFLSSGQSAQLMYIDNVDATIKGWRIINSGASFY